MRFVPWLVVFACLSLRPACFAQSPDSKESPENKGSIDGGNVYTNPTLKLKLALPGEWHFFDRQMYSSPEARQREKEMVERAQATCQGPLCGPSEIDVALQSLDVLPPPLYAIYLTAYPLSEEYQNRQRHSLKTFAEIMTIGSIRNQQWIAEGDLAAVQLDGHPAYRIIMHDKKTPTARAFAYVGDSNGRVFMLLGIATSLADKLQSAIERMQLPYPPTLTTANGNVVAAKLVEKVQPVYPSEAREKRIEGTVVLNVVIKKDGSVTVLGVKEGDALLSPAAIDAVQHWRYTPFLLNGEPVDMRTTIHVVFALTVQRH
jgi:TonB family protein